VIALADVAAHKATLLRQYLLHGPVQQRAGSNSGAVAGTLYADGQAHYVYGEITGYYLHWLASLPNAVDELRQPADMAVAWLGHYLQGASVPLTRIYLHEAPQDWRNDALFAFDLAMIAGGLARIANRGITRLPAPLAADLERWLQCFLGESELNVCIPRSPATVLPQRWSTLGGAFTAKTASRILLLGNQMALDERLLVACRTQLRHIAQQGEQNGLDMLHPTLYALEGCLLSPAADLERLAAWFEQIVALQGTDGSLPESLQTPDVRRTDIIAQALRVAVFLESLLLQPGRYRTVTEGFATALSSRVRADGSVAFSADGKPEANVWGAMFAEQALRLYAAHALGQPLPFIADAVV
jgi:hypothetical protein